MTQAAAAPPAPAQMGTSTPPEGATPQTVAKPKDAGVAQAPLATKEADEKTVRVRSYERAARVKAKLDSESDSAAEPSAPRPPARDDSAAESDPEPAAAKPTPPPAQDERAKHAAERSKRIAEVARREREAEAKRETQRASRTSEQEVEKLRKRVAELEPMNEVFASEEALLAAAEAKGMSAEKLVSWMRTRLSDPQAVAQRQAQTVEQKLRAEIEAIRAEQRRELDEIRAERQQMIEQREAVQRANDFGALAQEKAESHPRVMRLLRSKGLNAVVQFANAQIVPYINDGFELPHLHDVMEQYLDWLHDGGEGPSPVDSASGASHPPKKNGEAKPVTTLSNALGTERVSVTEETPLHRMPRSDRVRRLKEKLGGE
jgi:hypothetical protein